MGLDLYAGTLTRYFAQNWKSAVQQWAEQNGLEFSRVTPEGEGEDKPDPVEVQADMEQWRDMVLEAVSPETRPYPPWREDNEAPYYTDKPDWEAFHALLLYGACRRYGIALPQSVQKGYDYFEHPAMKRAEEDPELNWSLYIGAEWWIPVKDRFSFSCESPVGKELVIATTGTLLSELDRINETGWQADRETIFTWTQSEGYPVDVPLSEGGIGAFAPKTEYDTESLARFAFSIFYRAGLYSLEQRVPVLMDY